MIDTEQLPPHVIVNKGGPDRYDLNCNHCGIGISCGSHFGSIPGADFAAAFITEHLHLTHSSKGVRAGRTGVTNTPPPDDRA